MFTAAVCNGPKLNFPSVHQPEDAAHPATQWVTYQHTRRRWSEGPRAPAQTPRERLRAKSSQAKRVWGEATRPEGRALGFCGAGNHQPGGRGLGHWRPVHPALPSPPAPEDACTPAAPSCRPRGRTGHGKGILAPRRLTAHARHGRGGAWVVTGDLRADTQLLGAGGHSDKGYPSLEVSGTFWKTRCRV